MIRRLQLLPAEGGSSGNRLAAIGDRLRDGLLRDNKVVPAVLGFLSLLIFAWLIAGAIIGGPDEEEQQAANQSSLAQGEDSESGLQETPAPGAENRDSDSYSAFESKDPFRSLIPKAGEDKAGASKGGEPKAGEPKAGEPKAGEPKAGEPKAGEPKAGEPKAGEPKGATPPGGDRPGSPGSPGGNGPGGGQNGEDFVDQPFPGDPDFGSGAPQDTPSQVGNGQNGNGGLFNSGGDLPVP